MIESMNIPTVSLIPPVQTSNIEKKTYRQLPPLHISKIADDLPCGNIEEQDLSLKKIAYIVNRSYLISQENYAPFEPLSETTTTSHRIIAYSATRHHKNSRLIAALQPFQESESEEDEILDSEEEEILKNAKEREFLFFLIKQSVASTAMAHSSQDVYVLSTHYAYKIIEPFCSAEFSRDVCTSLSSGLIKIEQIVTGQLFGPISESELSFRNFLPTTVEQSGLVCREVTLLVRPFTDCLPGGQVKVKFSGKGMIIYRDLSIENYIEIIHFFATQNSPVFKQREWGLSKVSEEFSPVQDTQLIDLLDQMLLYYMIGDPLNAFNNCAFDLHLSTRLYEHASEFRLNYKIPKDVNSYSTSVPFQDPYYPPTFAELRSWLSNLYAKRVLMNRLRYPENPDTSIENVFKHKQVCIEYKEDDIWLSQDVLNCVEGCMKTSQDEVFFRLGSRWYIAYEKNYWQRVNEALSKVISDSILPPESKGHLFYSWPLKMNEEDYNRSYQFSLDNQIWMEGNRKRKSLGVEIGDIIHINEEGVFIYHVKKEFNHTIRDAATQLIMSAQIIRSSINHGFNTSDYSPLYQYCQTVTNNNPDVLIGALTRGPHYFVLAFRLKLEWTNLSQYQQCVEYQLIGSQSITAKREVIRAKEEIEKLGFKFRISIIQQHI